MDNLFNPVKAANYVEILTEKTSEEGKEGTTTFMKNIVYKDVLL